MTAEAFNELDFPRKATVMAFHAKFICEKKTGNYLLYKIYQVEDFFVRVTINTFSDTIISYRALLNPGSIAHYISKS
jgi:hypothetical protein